MTLSCRAGYEERFGHIFIVCATGKTAAQTLSLLRERLANDPRFKVQLAATFQGLALYGLLAWWLWLAACWRFRREQGHA